MVNYQGKVKGRRKTPNPNSILDRKAFIEALDTAGIDVKRLHIDELYKALHKQNYPPLQEFVENYWANERNNKGQQQLTDANMKNGKIVRKSRNKMTLPKKLIDYISTTSNFVNTTSRIKERFTSADRSTTKLIVELYDGFVVESVLMRYEQKGKGRASLCVSSQCGCSMGCTFCATGTMGLSGNLSTGEILEQLVHADRLLAEECLVCIEESKHDEEDDTINSNVIEKKRLESVRNVVFMGMGEPLDNYMNVTEACRTMIDRSRWNLAHGRVTISTVGLISQIRRLTKELPEVSLALSLHAPNQKDREAIVPTASRYPIEKLIDALDNHMMHFLNQKRERENKERITLKENKNAPDDQQLRTYTAEERIKESSRRRAMIEYIMLKGESTSLKCAHQLGKLCRNRHLVINLIPYNKTDVKDELDCPSEEHMLEFRDIVQSYGNFVTIRRTMGADIASACGQLVQKKNNEQHERKIITNESRIGTHLEGKEQSIDIEDVLNEKVKHGVKKTFIRATVSSKALHRVGTPEAKSNRDSLPSWIDSLSSNDLNRCSTLLTFVTTASFTCFLASAAVYLKRRR